MSAARTAKSLRVRVDRLKDLSEPEGRGALEGRSERWSNGRVAEGKDRQQREKAERDQQADKERGKQRHPSGGVCCLAVGNDQRQDGDGDGCDRYPEPNSWLAKCLHPGCLLEKV